MCSVCLEAKLWQPESYPQKFPSLVSETFHGFKSINSKLPTSLTMSVACSIPCINLPTSSSSPTTSSSSSSSASVRHSFRSVAIRCSQVDGPLRRPVVPPLREPSAPMPITPPPSSSAQVKVAAVTAEDRNLITLEFQRLKAKELQDYFRQKKVEEANQGPFFGFIGKNEIGNGRWAMFGFAVGMLTEYATGSSFVDQVKILLSNFGIVDLE